MYELTINLQPGAKAPLYEQIYEHIKCEIQEGHIRSGEKLPSTRALSRHLEVGRICGGGAIQGILCVPDRRTLSF